MTTVVASQFHGSSEGLQSRSHGGARLLVAEIEGVDGLEVTEWEGRFFAQRLRRHHNVGTADARVIAAVFREVPGAVFDVMEAAPD